MDRIMSIYNNIRKNNKLLTGIVAALGVCLLAVVVLFVCMPDIKAATIQNVTWTPNGGEYLLDDLTDHTSGKVSYATISVGSGDTINITGSDVVEKDLVININYTGTTGSVTSPAKVYVNLKNVKISQSEDYSAIKLSTNGAAVDFVVTVDGDNIISSSYQGAKQPLISVEATVYSVYKLKDYAGDHNTATVNDFIDEVDMSKCVNLILCGESPDDVLELSNGTGSYGALIGSGEVTSFAEASQREMQAYIRQLNDDALSANSNIIYVMNPSIEDILTSGTGQYKFASDGYGGFFPQYAFNATESTASGKITIGGNSEVGIKPLSLVLKNGGCGAAIGGGGCEGTDPSKQKGSNVGKITINGGTITYKSTGSLAPVFGSGYLAGASNIASTYGTHSGVEINGGSLFFNGYQNKFGDVLAVNKEGKRLYEIKATNEFLDELSSKNDDELLKLEYIYDSSLELSVDLDTYTVSKVKDILTSKIADVEITLSPTIKYYYAGEGHGSDSLYFYLPAVQTTTLTITDEFGLGHAQFIVKGADGTEVRPKSSDPTSPDSRVYTLMRDQIYFIYASQLPTGLSIKSVTLSTGGEAGYNQALGYQVDAITGSITAHVLYSGKIDIVYDDGLISSDRDNHNVTIPSTDYEYGTEVFTLDNLGTIYKNCTVGGSVVDIIFDKWVYTDASGKELGNITHIVKNQSVDGNQRKYSDIVQSDGKIYLKAKWKIKVDFVIGEDATYGGTLPVVEVEYAYGTGNIINVSIPNAVPTKDSFAFAGWTVDDGTDMYNYSTVVGAINEVELSSLTSHRFYANYERTDFCVYIDASALDEKYASLTCLDQRGMDMLVKNSDGSLATVVVDGRTYYYTTGVIKNTNVRVVIKTKHGYKMENTSVKVTGSASSDVMTNGASGECTADIVIETQDVYVTTNATFKPVEYEILFKDGKVPNEVLWGGSKFTYSIDDIAANKTIGDIIREGLGDMSMSDAAIAAYINTIPKNDRFTDFYGFNMSLYTDTLSMDKTIASIYAENPTLTYGDMVFTAEWKEYDKYTINMNLFERVFDENGLYRDVRTDDLVVVLYYYADGVNKAPVYTEQIIDPVTGDEKTVAYAKAGDKIEIALYRANSKGNPIGDPVTAGIVFEELYYEYESKLNESVHADIKDGSKSFTVKDDVKDGTTIEVYMAFSLKKYNIVYWDTKGFDNSLNPITYTIFDEIEFVPITEGVDWLLVCPDTDDSNYDDVTTEVIYKINQDGKLVTDGSASNRDYISNLILKPDWSQYLEDSYSVTISLGDSPYGTVKIIYPQGTNEFFANDMVLLSVVPNKGYKLVNNSLTYKKEAPTTFSALRTNLLTRKELNEVIIPAVDAENGTYIITMPSSDIVVSALFELCQYNITYSDMTDDVVNANPDSYNVNSIIELAEPVREGYVFLGWFDSEGNKVTRIVGRTGDLVLTPKFELISEDAGDTKPEDNKPEDNKPGDSNKPGTSDKPTGTDKPNNGGVGGNGDINNGNTGIDGSGNSGNTGTNKPGNSGNVTITGRPSNVVSRPIGGTSGTITKPGTNNQSGVSGNIGSNVQTGDKTNVPKLALICAGAVLILLIFALKKPSKKDDE